MIENLSLKIAKSVIPENEASSSNIAIISYGVQAIISTLATLLLSLFIAIFFSNKVFELLLFSITFVPIRLLHKGYHCKTFFMCNISSKYYSIKILFILSAYYATYRVLGISRKKERICYIWSYIYIYFKYILWRLYNFLFFNFAHKQYINNRRKISWQLCWF